MLEVKLALPEGEDPPLWVQELLDSGLVHEVNKFSKFLHGTATLMPHTVEHAPYWFDDASIRPSIIAAHVPVASGLGAQTRQQGMEDFGTELTDTSSVLSFTVGSGKQRARNKSSSGNKRSSMLETLTAGDALGSQPESAYEGEHPFQPVRRLLFPMTKLPQLPHKHLRGHAVLGSVLHNYAMHACATYR